MYSKNEASMRFNFRTLLAMMKRPLVTCRAARQGFMDGMKGRLFTVGDEYVTKEERQTIQQYYDTKP